jgi:hypothetical protein
MILQYYDLTIIHTAGKNNILTDARSRIYEERTVNIEAGIMEDPTINKSFSALTFQLLLSSQDLYLPLSYPHSTTSNAIFYPLVLSSDPGNYYYKYQPDTITGMSGI